MEAIRKHSVKIQIGTIVTVALFIITSVWWVANKDKNHTVRIASIETAIAINEEHIENSEAHIASLQQKLASHDLVLVEVKTQLANIASLLQELRTDLKKITNTL